MFQKTDPEAPDCRALALDAYCTPFVHVFCPPRRQLIQGVRFQNDQPRSMIPFAVMSVRFSMKVALLRNP